MEIYITKTFSADYDEATKLVNKIADKLEIKDRHYHCYQYDLKKGKQSKNKRFYSYIEGFDDMFDKFVIRFSNQEEKKFADHIISDISFMKRIRTYHL